MTETQQRTTRPRRKLTADESQRWETELLSRLGVVGPLPTALRVRGLLVALVAGLLAFFTRFWNLGHPRELIFDETYYVKGAYSLLTQGFEGAWEGDNANLHFLDGDYSFALTNNPDYVVHPPLGKWLMAIGQAIFGTDNGLGWRFTTAVLGVASVLLIVYIALRLFRSPLLAGFAGLAMALDGMGITMSRTGLLDNILAFFVLAAFTTLLLDRDWTRTRLARRVASGEFVDDGVRPTDAWGPRLFARPWMVATGVLLGLACGVKWSGLYAIAVFGLIAFFWGVSARRTVGVRLWFGAGVFQEGVPAFIALVPTALITYVATWYPWFRNPHGYDRHWAEDALAQGESLPWPWAPKALNSLLHYHESMWSFHNGLSSPHDYQSQAWQWLFQLRPVSFYWLGEEERATLCPDSSCAQAITSVGNPAVWWLAVVGLAVVIWGAFIARDWRAWAILSGYLATWAPWLIYTHRTIFQFYAVAVLPFVVLALTYGLAQLSGTLGHSRGKPQAWEQVVDGVVVEEVAEVVDPYDPEVLFAVDDIVPQTVKPDVPWWQPPAPSTRALVAIGVVSGLIIAAAVFWMPLWWGTTVSYNWWHAHMWLTSWI